MVKENHADNKKDGINNSGYNNPFPQLMLPDKLMGLEIGLYSYNDFFEQLGVFSVCKFT